MTLSGEQSVFHRRENTVTFEKKVRWTAARRTSAPTS